MLGGLGVGGQDDVLGRDLGEEHLERTVGAAAHVQTAAPRLGALRGVAADVAATGLLPQVGREGEGLSKVQEVRRLPGAGSGLGSVGGRAA